MSPTSIKQSVDAIGEEAVRTLTARMARNGRKACTRLIPAELVVRSSTAPECTEPARTERVAVQET